MSSKSAAQARLMAAKCKNPKRIKAKGLSQRVACEFHRHDKAKGRRRA